MGWAVASDYLSRLLSRDDQLVSGQSGTFHPPEGLLVHELVEFICGKGSLGRLFPAAAIGLGGIFLAAGLLNPTSNCYNKNGVLQTPTQCAPTNLLFAVLGGVMLLAGLVLALRAPRQTDTPYYMTTFRLVEAKQRRIVREVPRDLFRGREFSQFLQVIPTLIVNGTPFFTAKILDPRSGDEEGSPVNDQSRNYLEELGELSSPKQIPKIG